VPDAVGVPGASTAVAAAPSLTGVDTNFVSVLGAPFGIAITPNSHDAFVASPTGSLLEYSLDVSIPHLVRIDTFGTPQPHRAPTAHPPRVPRRAGSRSHQTGGSWSVPLAVALSSSMSGASKSTGQRPRRGRPGRFRLPEAGRSKRRSREMATLSSYRSKTVTKSRSSTWGEHCDRAPGGPT